MLQLDAKQIKALVSIVAMVGYHDMECDNCHHYNESRVFATEGAWHHIDEIEDKLGYKIIKEGELTDEWKAEVIN